MISVAFSLFIPHFSLLPSILFYIMQLLFVTYSISQYESALHFIWSQLDMCLYSYSIPFKCVVVLCLSGLFQNRSKHG